MDVAVQDREVTSPVDTHASGNAAFLDARQGKSLHKWDKAAGSIAKKPQHVGERGLSQKSSDRDEQSPCAPIARQNRD